MLIKIFRNSKIITLIRTPILENPNMTNVPKVLVLQHCRGMENVVYDINSDSDYEIDGYVTDQSHSMVSKLKPVQSAIMDIKDIFAEITHKIFRMTQSFFGQHLREIQQYELKMDQFIWNISSSA